MRDDTPISSGAGPTAACMMRSSLAARASLLAVSLVLVLVAVACGRASEDDINAALGITPSPTLNTEQVAAATGTAVALATSRAELAASPGTGGGGGDAAMFLAGGDVTRGQVVFLQNCQSCHGGAPTAPNLMQPNPDVDLSPERFLAVVRNGEGHQPRPGPMGAQRISDESLRNLYAFILSRVQPS